MTTTIRNVSRRDFVTAGSGLALAVSLPGARHLADSLAARAADPVTADAFSPGVYLRIDATGIVTIIAHRSEMGQGIRTALPMALADELEADWSKVRIEQATGDEALYQTGVAYIDASGTQNTDGSRSLRHYLRPVRVAGATARAMLEAAAARHWNVPVTEVTARLHQVLHTPTGRTVSYGELVAIARDLPVPSKDQIRLKEPAAFRYIGKELPGVDLFDITTGRAKYGIDQTPAGTVSYTHLTLPTICSV